MGELSQRGEEDENADDSYAVGFSIFFFSQIKITENPRKVYERERGRKSFSFFRMKIERERES